MSVSFENKATNRGVITFTIGQDKIKPALDKAFNKIKKELFRSHPVLLWITFVLLSFIVLRE